jgi:hypothetical protein
MVYLPEIEDLGINKNISYKDHLSLMFTFALVNETDLFAKASSLLRRGR